MSKARDIANLGSVATGIATDQEVLDAATNDQQIVSGQVFN